MSLWTWVVMTVALAACKKDECQAARKDVADDLKSAYEGVLLEQDNLKHNAEKAAVIPAGYPSRAANLEQQFKLLEQSMDCLVHKDDCCARLSTLSIQERTPIQSMAMRAEDTEGLPVEIAGLMGPLREVTENIDAIGTGAEDLKLITPWCTKVRDAIAQFRAAAPAAWKAATDEANKLAAEAKAAVAAHDALVDVIAGWARAIEESQSVTIPTDTPNSKEFTRGRTAIERYQKACH